MTEFYGFPQHCPIMHQLIARSTADAATQPKRLYYVSAGEEIDHQPPSYRHGLAMSCSLQSWDLCPPHLCPKLRMVPHCVYKTGVQPAPDLCMWLQLFPAESRPAARLLDIFCARTCEAVSARTTCIVPNPEWAAWVQASRACWWQTRQSSSRSLPQASRSVLHLVWLAIDPEVCCVPV